MFLLVTAPHSGDKDATACMLTVVSGSTIRFYDVKSGRTYGQKDMEGRVEDNKLVLRSQHKLKFCSNVQASFCCCIAFCSFVPREEVSPFIIGGEVW
ncbi:hypothetical protein TrRE_jg10869 [Triparma retinervis]|uniref:Uncharacterized protein n=1 Tax=Triparma retinervis TaxID=2557542 RepID=A0A9W7A407_9STRA|nr:hypothetical protein TrRE_jg10869 [Triparma retinervis]